MAENDQEIPPAPDPMTPEYMIRLQTDQALQMLLMNPATSPDLTPPTEASMAARGLPPRPKVSGPAAIMAMGRRAIAPTDAPTGDALAQPTLTNPNLQQQVPSSTAHFSDAELTPEAKAALDTLVKDGLVVQVDDHSWRFK